MTLEQHTFELWESTYTKKFFFQINTVVISDPQLIESASAESGYRGLTISYLQIFRCTDSVTQAPHCSRVNCTLFDCFLYTDLANRCQNGLIFTLVDLLGDYYELVRLMIIILYRCAFCGCAAELRIKVYDSYLYFNHSAPHHGLRAQAALFLCLWNSVFN